MSSGHPSISSPTSTTANSANYKIQTDDIRWCGVVVIIALETFPEAPVLISQIFFSSLISLEIQVKQGI